MLNQTLVVGRMVNEPVLEENENGKKVCVVTLAVPRSFKNSEGEYDTDYIDVTLWDKIASNTIEYCKQGDVLGIKGRLQKLKGNSLQVVAEKVTFISSKK